MAAIAEARAALGWVAAVRAAEATSSPGTSSRVRAATGFGNVGDARTAARDAALRDGTSVTTATLAAIREFRAAQVLAIKIEKNKSGPRETTVTEGIADFLAGIISLVTSISPEEAKLIVDEKMTSMGVRG